MTQISKLTNSVIVYVGSTRAAKVDGTRDAVAALAGVHRAFAAAEIRSIEVSDAAPRMPMTKAEIVGGAAARARALVQRVEVFEEGSSYFVGLEGGLDPITLDGTSRLALTSWACVTDGRRWGYGSGGAVVLPERLAADIFGGRELGDVIDGLIGAPVRGTRGAWGVLTHDLVTRRESFRVAVISAFAPFLSPELYGAE